MNPIATSPLDPPADSSSASQQAPAVRVARARVLLGTLVAVEATSDSAAKAAEAIAAAFAALTEIDRRLHPHSSDSDLAKINSAPLGTRVAVHPTTCHLLELAQQLNTLT